MVAGLALQAGVNLVNDFFEFRQGKVDDKVADLGFGAKDRNLLEWLIFLVGLAFFGSCRPHRAVPGVALGVAAAGSRGRRVSRRVLLHGRAAQLQAARARGGPGVLPHGRLHGGRRRLRRVRARSTGAWCFASIPVSILVSLILLANELRDFEADSRHGIRTLAVRIGYRRAIGVYCVLLFCAYLGPLVLWTRRPLPRPGLVLLALPFAVPPFLFMRRPAERRAGIIPLVMLHHLAFGSLFCASYFIRRVRKTGMEGST